ncbi:DNase I-like protein [Durotheca rogersii]|uniref:DNase I-like protein n=1 Tax=Durotheca rogersii TaxID=419775 RepID=UPI002220173C|nr:DNase I-like protein [Durotheca rogersii]KAI5858306.1 DNase I-like protein [Durotheca rogersii]
MKSATMLLRGLGTALLIAASTSAETIAQINGDRFLSPLDGQQVTNVTGVVTAKGPDGIWIRSVERSRDRRVSDGLYVYGSVLARNTSISTGDVLVLSGKITEYRSNRNYLYLTELTAPNVTAVLERGTTVRPLVIGGKGLPSPPTEQYSGLDGGDVFAVPNNQSLVSVENPILRPEAYGLDYWESLMGELVTIENPRAVGRPNQYGDTWVVGGSWKTSGDNERTGLTISAGDGNPEAIIIGTPLDQSKNPSETRLGDKLESITGVVSQAFGFYRILPLTGITVVESLAPQLPPPTTLASDGTCAGITVASYNVENLAAADAAHLKALARDVVDYLRLPDLLAVQEVQDDSGETNDGTVDSDATLGALAAAIGEASGGAATYNYTYVSPVDGQSGGAPGANIRVAYLYRGDLLRLREAEGAGDAQTATEVLPGPELRYNPGLVDPRNVAWTNSRKPLAAAWELVDGTSKTLFTVNVHWGSKGGSSSLHGDARPPVNGGVNSRSAQAEVTANFISSILEESSSAYVVALGDFNEFAFVAPLTEFAERSGLVDLDVAAEIAPAERYSYLYDMNSQELDHVFASPALAGSDRLKGFEHIHANTWLPYSERTSDHDPAVAKFNIC